MAVAGVKHPQESLLISSWSGRILCVLERRQLKRPQSTAGRGVQRKQLDGDIKLNGLRLAASVHFAC